MPSFALLVPLPCDFARDTESNFRAMLDSCVRDASETSSDTDDEDNGNPPNEPVKFTFFIGADREVRVPLGVPRPSYVHLASAVREKSSSFAVSLSTFDRMDFGENWSSECFRKLGFQAQVGGEEDGDGGGFVSNEFVVFMNPEVKSTLEHWPRVVQKEFERMAKTTGLPFGFGMVAFRKNANEACPEFFVLHKTHFQIFSGIAFPHNLNVSPGRFLYEVYNRFGCARVLANCANFVNPESLMKFEPPLSLAKPAIDFAVDHASSWLALVLGQESQRTMPKLALDVVVPSYRVDHDILDRIAKLIVPSTTCTRFVFVLDDPRRRDDFAALKARYAHRPDVLILFNEVNLGSGPTRSRGLDQCAGEFVTLLDDDVIVKPDLLEIYSQTIRKHEKKQAVGFVGQTVLPPPSTPRQLATKDLGITFFWQVAGIPDGVDLDWSITANVVVRNLDVRFRDVFIRKGGGEDIDYCFLLKQKWTRDRPDRRGFMKCPEAVVQHPWWNNGTCPRRHFYNWAGGESELNTLWPQYAFVSLPDVLEFLLLHIAAELIIFHRLPRFYTFTFVYMAFFLGDWLNEFVNLLSTRRKEFPIAFLAESAMERILIRGCRSYGRLRRFALNGNLLCNIMKRCDWHLSAMPNFPMLQRRQEFVAWVWRFGTLGAAVGAVAACKAVCGK